MRKELGIYYYSDNDHKIEHTVSDFKKEMKLANLIIEELMDLKEDGSFKLNMKYFNYATGLTMTNKKFSNLFVS